MIASNPRSNNNNRPPSSAEGSSLPASAARLTPPRGGGTDNNDDTSDVARAAAEVSVLPPTGPSTGVGGEAGARSTTGGPRSRPPGQEAANAAIQGTAAGEGGEAAAFEVVDEGGELVKVRFHEFLNN